MDAQGITKVKNIVLFFVKLSISSILLSYLIFRAGSDQIIGLFTDIKGINLFASILCYLAIILVSALRLQLLIRYRLALRSVFAISAIGYFFNLFLPSGISGDVARAYYINKETKWANKDTIDLVAPLFMERYLGLGSILIIGLGVLPFAVRLFGKDELMNIIYLTIVLLLCIILIGVFVFNRRLFAKNPHIFSFYRYVDSFKDTRYLAAIFFYSVMIQLISIYAIFLISDGMGLEVSLFHYGVIIPIINIITILPITLGGIGLREGSFVFFLASQGILPHSAIALSLISFFSSVAASLVGLYEYLQYRSKHL